MTNYLVVTDPMGAPIKVVEIEDCDIADKMFTQECQDYGVDPSTENYAAGSMELESGETIEVFYDCDASKMEEILHLRGWA